MKAGILILAAAAALGACATGGSSAGGRSGPSTAQFQSNPAQPAAEGAVKFGAGKNDNTTINLTVKHLARPDKLNPSESAYVVWTKRDAQSPAQNVGALAVDKNLTGTLVTKTPLHHGDLFITAEPNSQVEQPSGTKQLWTSFSR